MSLPKFLILAINLLKIKLVQADFPFELDDLSLLLEFLLPNSFNFLLELAILVFGGCYLSLDKLNFLDDHFVVHFNIPYFIVFVLYYLLVFLIVFFVG